MNNSEEEIQEKKEKIIRYVNLLYKFLGDKYCFTSGAFVIQDNDNKLHTLLSSVYDENLTEKGVYTHTIFKDDSDIMYEIHFTEKQLNSEIKCKCLDGTINTRKIKNIKFYKFINNNINFVYLKLESTTTFNTIHLKHMIKKHYFNIENKSCVIPRREDCNHKKRKNCKFYNDDSKKIKKNFSGIIIKLIRNYSNKENSNPNIYPFDTDDIPLDLNEDINTELKKSYDIVKINDEECDITETYFRKGDEFFIPYCLNEFFINNIEDNYIKFDFDNENNNINIRNNKEPIPPTSNTNGGKTKKIKYIRHYSQRKKQSNKKKKTKMIHRSLKKN